jgi:hypothetical protein
MELPRRPLTGLEYNDLKRRICLSKQRIRDVLKRRSTFGDRVEVTDEILVYEGAGENRKLKFASKGHIVNQGLIHIVNLLSPTALAYSSGLHGTSYQWTSRTTYMRLGTGGNVTTGSVTQLTTLVSTPPDSQAGSSSSPSAGTYRISWTATWNAGTLTAITVSEIGLFLDLVATLQGFGWTYGGGGTALFSRLSAADGDFTAFVVNTSVPLTIEWRLTFTFA